jgi:polyphosphate kinase
MEAASESVPLLERLKFLSIFSSNLDEFFRVRISAIQSLHKLKASEKKNSKLILTNINDTVYTQQEIFGQLLENSILPQLKDKGIFVVYNEEIPEEIKQEAVNYFLHNIAAYIKVIFLKEDISFFPENNKLYLLRLLKGKRKKILHSSIFLQKTQAGSSLSGNMHISMSFLLTISSGYAFLISSRIRSLPVLTL